MSSRFQLILVLVSIIIIAFAFVADSAAPVKKEETGADGKCADKATNCKKLIANCGDKLFESKLKEVCNKTCGHCAPGAKDCADVSKNCKKMKTDGFCDTKSNPINVQRMYCSKTCGV